MAGVSEVTRAIAIGNLVAASAFLLSLCASAADDDDALRKCPEVKPFEWERAAIPGVEEIRNARFEFEIGEGTVDRLIERQYAEAREKILKDLKVGEAAFDKEEGDALKEKIREKLAERLQRQICFDVLRVDLEKATVELVNVIEEVESRTGVKDGVRLATVDDKTGYLPVDFDVKTLAEGRPIQDGVLGYFNAGWSEGITRPAPVGYLKVDGNVVTDTFFPSLSAVLCIVRKGERTSDIRYYYSQVYGKFSFNEWYYRSASRWANVYRAEFKKCHDAVQVGPRVVERDNTDFYKEYKKYLGCIDDLEDVFPDFKKKIGICESSILTPPRRRTVIASTVVGDGAGEGGFLYILLTHNAVALYDMQMLLLRSDLITEKADMWAVNLAGDRQFFQYSRTRSGGWVKDGLSTTASSALRVRGLVVPSRMII